MTAVASTGTASTAAATNSRARGPRISFFWWLNASQSAEAPSTQTMRDEGCDYSESAFIPTSTANLWDSGKPGH